ncbi:hypothetical protein TELCIR_06007 [Teladorsagia circumcincta]|uniref:Phorbol-ester/DAG-type domain-containing protein n=1 Tax=Teladorsagia circumcincta TaxID=45464 RepID=A0A2G9UPB1_TELCI|nr:hypothetical protein TELCIR_06007 [Teladorsagia circumcincta]
MDARPRPVCRAAKQLLAIVDNRPLIDLSEAHSSLTKYHKECEICAGNGFYCELCEDQEQRNQLLFPFSENVAMCPKCLAVFHSKCYEKRSSTCTRCERRRKRADSARED